MQKLMMGSGLALMALGAAVAAAQVPTTKDGAVVVTESRCQPAAAAEGDKATSVAQDAKGATANAASHVWPVKFPSGGVTGIKAENNLPAPTTAKGATSRLATADGIHYKMGRADSLPRAKTTVPTTACDSADFLKVQ